MEKCAVHDTCFNALEKRFSGVEQKMDDFKTDIKDLREDIRLLAQKLDKWSRGYAVQDNKIGTICDSVGWLKKRQEELEKEISRLKYKLAFLSASVSLVISILFLYMKSKGM